MVYGLIVGNELFHLKNSISDKKYHEFCQVSFSIS